MALRACFLLLLIPFALGSARAGDDAVEVRRVLWSGRLDALERQHPRAAFQLAPGGKGFLYFQGAPWPRLLYRSLDDPSAEPRMLSRSVPYSSLPPRFNPQGDAVFFTAVTNLESLDAPTARQRPLALKLVRVDLADLKVERLHPPEGSPDDAFSVLLDVHPSGDWILAGAGADLRTRDLRRSEGPMRLLEISTQVGNRERAPPRELGIQVNRQSFVRYSRDGRRVEYTLAPHDDPGAEVFALDRESLKGFQTGVRSGSLARHAGDLDLRTFQWPHRGSFGWDGFQSYDVSPGGSAASLPLRFAPEVAALSILPPEPVAFRGDRVLLCGGLQDRPLVIVAAFTATGGAGGKPQPAGTRLALDPRFGKGGVLARVDPETAPLLERLRGTLQSPQASEVRAVRAELRQVGTSVAAGTVQAVTVHEKLPGLFLAERSFTPEAGEAEKPAEKPAAEEILPEPQTQILASDGSECWMKLEDGRFQVVEEAFVSLEVNSLSVFRLLLDPAGLGDPELRFAKAVAAEPGEDGAARWRLPYSYADGYSGELVVEEREGGVRPLVWESPLIFSSHALEQAIGNVPKTKSLHFEDFRSFAGRLIPHRLRFENGFEPHVLEVVKLEVLDDLDEKVFRMPGKRG